MAKIDLLPGPRAEQALAIEEEAQSTIRRPVGRCGSRMRQEPLGRREDRIMCGTLKRGSCQPNPQATQPA